MQRVSDSVGRCATRMWATYRCCRSTFVFSVFRLVSRRCHNISTIHQLCPVIATHRVVFPIIAQGRHSRGLISELNTSPAYPRANASPPPLRVADA